MKQELSSQVEARKREIYRVTFVGLVVNLLLSAAKLVAGVIGRSAAMTADAVHSFSDLATDVVVIAFARISSKPQDESHDYGHGKYETLATLLISLALAVVGSGILVSGIRSIRVVIEGGTLPRPGAIALVAAVVSIVGKEILYRYTVRVGRRIDSPSVVANAWHHRSDALSSVGTAIGIGGAMALGSQWTVLDPIAAVIVSLLIIMQAVKQIRQSSDELLEKSLPDDVERRIKDIVLEEEGASDIHHLCTRRIGSAVAMEMHVRMPGGMTLAESHERATAIERRLRAEFGQRTHISLHVEPLKPDKGQAGTGQGR